MTPSGASTGEAFADEKIESKLSASPTNTDATLAGKKIDEASTLGPETERPESLSYSVDVESVQPQNKAKGLRFLTRITKPFRSVPEPEGVLETRTRKLEETPDGFPRLAAFQSSDANFALYRSFGYLHSRVLLDLQDELTSLEKELDEIDCDDSDQCPNRLKSREVDVHKARNEGNIRNRRVIMREIRERLKEYDDVLIKARTLESFQKPSARDYRSVRRYLHNTKPLLDAEMDSIRSKEDIVSLHNGREWTAFDGGVESAIASIDRVLTKVFKIKTPPLQHIFRTPELKEKTSDAYLPFYSASRVEKLINFFITFVIFILLVIPIVAMYHLTSKPEDNNPSSSSSSSSISSGSSSLHSHTVNNSFNAVGVLIVFTLVFSATMSLLTKAARHELFAASAAYCAILVVFIANFIGPGN